MKNSNFKSQALPYVYRCTERNTGKFYIGYRFKNILPAHEDFGTHYFTSNEYVKSNFQNFDYEILSEFPDRQTAFQYETKMIRETCSHLQINSNKHNKTKRPYQKAVVHEYCLFPGCEKRINSSIKRFCCKNHASRYSALKKHGKIK